MLKLSKQIIHASFHVGIIKKSRFFWNLISMIAPYRSVSFFSGRYGWSSVHSFHLCKSNLLNSLKVSWSAHDVRCWEVENMRWWDVNSDESEVKTWKIALLHFSVDLPMCIHFSTIMLALAWVKWEIAKIFRFPITARFVLRHRELIFLVLKLLYSIYDLWLRRLLLSAVKL